jgi:hypothetical protein
MAEDETKTRAMKAVAQYSDDFEVRGCREEDGRRAGATGARHLWRRR